MVREFLPMGDTDTRETYDARIKAASYRSYVGPIVDFYASQLFASTHVVRAMRDGETVDSIDPYYATLVEDCDGQGTDFKTFMKDRFVQALIKRVAYWVLELPRDTEELPPATREEWDARGLGNVRMIPLDAENVMDWEADDDGRYAWVKTHSIGWKRLSPADEKPICVETWKVYYKDRVDVYRIEYTKKPKDTVQVPMVDSYAHGFACVPIQCVRLPEGLWLVDRASDAQVEHFRMSCALGWSLRRAAYAIGVFRLDNNTDKPTVGRGFAITIGKDDSFEWAEPACSSVAVLRDEIKAQKDEIYRVTQQMAASADTNAAALGRSGLSKIQDKDATEICLRGYATHVREAIEATYQLIAEARGDSDLTFSVEGMSTFSGDDVVTLVDTATKAKTIGIQSDTFKRELHWRIAAALLPSDVSQTTRDRVHHEIMTAPIKAEPSQDSKPDASDDPANDGDENDESRTTTDPATPLEGME